MGALTGANVIWAGSAVASKATLDTLPPLVMSSLRVAIALLVLHVILVRGGTPIATGRAPAMLGLSGVALFCACQNLGLLFTDATTTALIGAATPVLTVMIALPFLGERLSGGRLAGLTLSLTGVGIIVLMGSGHLEGTAALASLLPLASATSFAAYNVLGRHAFNGGNALSLVAGSTRYGLLYLLPLMVIEMTRTDIAQVSVGDGLLLLYLGIGCSAVAFILCGYGLSHLGAGHSAIYGNLKPLAGVILAMMLLDEPLTLQQVVGGLLVVFGVGIASAVRQ